MGEWILVEYKPIGKRQEIHVVLAETQWGGGNGRNTIQNVRSHIQQLPKPSKQCILPF